LIFIGSNSILFFSNANVRCLVRACVWHRAASACPHWCNHDSTQLDTIVSTSGLSMGKCATTFGHSCQPRLSCAALRLAAAWRMRPCALLEGAVTARKGASCGTAGGERALRSERAGSPTADERELAADAEEVGRARGCKRATRARSAASRCGLLLCLGSSS